MKTCVTCSKVKRLSFTSESDELEQGREFRILSSNTLILHTRNYINPESDEWVQSPGYRSVLVSLDLEGWVTLQQVMERL